MKRIVIDARMYGLEHTGIGRYVMNLVRGFKRIKNTNFKITLLVPRKKLVEIKKELGNTFDYYPADSAHYSFAEKIEIPLILKKIKPDLVHFPHFNIPLLYKGEIVSTIHDLTKHYFRGKETTTRQPIFYWLKYLAYRFQVFWTLKKSSLIFVPSDYWKEELITKFKVSKDKVVVTYEAVDPQFIKLTKEIREEDEVEFPFDKPFLIYTGNVYPHKNIKRLLKALRKVKEVRLAIVCGRSVFTTRIEQLIKQYGLEERVKFLGFVPDEQLIGIYRKAVALIHPSLMEGFGLTGLEAMAASCPVLSSNASCLPEIYGKAAYYFDPLKVDQMVGAIKKVLKDKKLRKELVEKGKERVNQFSWDKTIGQTVKGYLKVL